MGRLSRQARDKQTQRDREAEKKNLQQLTREFLSHINVHIYHMAGQTRLGLIRLPVTTFRTRPASPTRPRLSIAASLRACWSARSTQRMSRCA